ncbi:MAG: hypothetical protein R6U55_08435 [Desulfovermiculus sp.]
MLVDEWLQTSASNVFACGGAAQARELLSGERQVLGLYPVAVEQGRVAGQNALGRNRAYEPQTSMNSLKGLSFQLITAGRQQGKRWPLRAETGCRSSLCTRTGCRDLCSWARWSKPGYT